MNSVNGTNNYLINIQADKNEIEDSFQKAYDNNDWNTMWMCVHQACLNIAKSMYKKRGVIIDDDELLEKVIDASAYVMKFVKKGVRPDKLSSYCYLRVLRYVNDKKEIERNQNESQFPLDNYKDIPMEIEGDYYNG